jgi:hypothetical protein
MHRACYTSLALLSSFTPRNVSDYYSNEFSDVAK